MRGKMYGVKLIYTGNHYYTKIISKMCTKITMQLYFLQSRDIVYTRTHLHSQCITGVSVVGVGLVICGALQGGCDPSCRAILFSDEKIQSLGLAICNHHKVMGAHLSPDSIPFNSIKLLSDDLYVSRLTRFLFSLLRH